MDSMYEINRRRRSRSRSRTKQQENTFKSIPNLSLGPEYAEGLYSYNGLEANTDRMYRSLGYIPDTDTAQADIWTQQQEHIQQDDTWKRTSSKKRLGVEREEERDRKLWSKSSDHLECEAEAWRRYQPAPWAAGGLSESYQHNYVVKDHRDHLSLPYAGSHTLTRRQQAPAPPPVMVGGMRYKRDLIFSRWQERTFVLTNKYLKSFARNNIKLAGTTSLPHQPQAKPQVLWKVKLTDIENMDLTTKRGHLTIKLQVHGENCKVMLRSGQDTKTWFDMIMACCHQSVAGNIQSQYWEKQPMPPSRSESIQRWLLGRPPVAAGVNQAHSLQYQHLSNYQYDDSWVPDHQTFSMSTKTRTRSLSRPKTSMGSQIKSNKHKPESQDSGNSSLSSPTLPNSTKYSSQPHWLY